MASSLRSLCAMRKNLAADRDALDKRISALDAAIAVFEDDGQVQRATPPKRRGNPSKIVAEAEAVLRAANRPMFRGDIADALIGRGVDIPSKDPARYIGTILWRNQDRFENVPEAGYRPRDPAPVSGEGE